MSNWQVVFKSEQEYRIQIVKNILENKNINLVVINKKISGYDIGDYEILVSPENVIKSLKIIEENIRFE